MKSVTSLVTDLMGTKLRTPNGEEIGVVQNVMVNPSDGTIIFIFLCYANFIGKVHRHFAIPRQQLTFKDKGGALCFEIEEHCLVDASLFNETASLGRLSGSEFEFMYQPRLAG